MKAEETCLDADGRLSARLVRPFSWAPGNNRLLRRRETRLRFSVKSKVFGTQGALDPSSHLGAIAHVGIRCRVGGAALVQPIGEKSSGMAMEDGDEGCLGLLKPGSGAVVRQSVFLLTLTVMLMVGLMTAFAACGSTKAGDTILTIDQATRCKPG